MSFLIFIPAMEINDLKSSNRYFIAAFGKMKVQHGGIGYFDIERILLDEGYQAIELPESVDFVSRFNRLKIAGEWIRNLTKNDTLVVQFPVYAKLHRYMIRRLAAKKIRIIFILSDIDGLKDGDPHVLSKEISVMRSASAFIVHSPEMDRWLKSVIPGARSAILGPFDFLCTPILRPREPSNQLAFAGNLQKSGFISLLDQIPEINFHLYGAGISPDAKTHPNCTWHGSYDPCDLPKRMEGSFGLIWDGTGINGPEGPLGTYLGFIYPHKLSLYIMSGLPVIVPAFAATANFVKKHEIGWIVNGFNEIPKLIKSIEKRSYDLAVSNISKLSEPISKGLHLRNALRKVTP
jgi:hypothetical protein